MLNLLASGWPMHAAKLTAGPAKMHTGIMVPAAVSLTKLGADSKNALQAARASPSEKEVNRSAAATHLKRAA